MQSLSPDNLYIYARIYTASVRAVPRVGPMLEKRVFSSRYTLLLSPSLCRKPCVDLHRPNETSPLSLSHMPAPLNFRGKPRRPLFHSYAWHSAGVPRHGRTVGVWHRMPLRDRYFIYIIYIAIRCDTFASGAKGRCVIAEIRSQPKKVQKIVRGKVTRVYYTIFYT